MRLPNFYVDNIIKTALSEDLPYIDITTDLLIDQSSISSASFIAKDDGILCGIDIALRVFSFFDDTFTFNKFRNDGDTLKKGDIIATVSGKTAALLKGERTALNLVQHMSGIATTAGKCAAKTAGTKAVIVETRKTLPGLRSLQKYAVTIGGGRNHRINLSDAAMLKDNHIDAYGGITNAVSALRSKLGHMVKIEVEVRNFDELREAIIAGADVVMLDNMSVEDMAEAVKIADSKVILEASGNITLENIAQVAKTGVDVISMGSLTHSVKAFDISMKIK